MKLYTKILIGLVAGTLIGTIANLAAIEWLKDVLGSIEILGTAFINLITMIVIPLVVASLLVGTASLGDLRKLGRIGGKTITYYMMTTAIAVTIGLVRAKASRQSHAELDNSNELDDGDPEGLAAACAMLGDRLPGLLVLGGCCGTDLRHVAAIGHHVIQRQGKAGEAA